MKADKTSIQAALAIASFSVGSIIACVCLFLIPPRGEITNSAIGIVSQFLVLCGALLGIKTSMDWKLQKFEGEVTKRAEELDRKIESK